MENPCAAEDLPVFHWRYGWDADSKRKEKGCLWDWRRGIPCDLPSADGQIFLHMAAGKTGEINMSNEKIYGMSFSKIYPLLVSKAQKKGHTFEEVTQIITWLTGYTAEEIEKAAAGSLTYGDFFLNAPQLNPNRKLITGVVCGVRVETIEEPLMQEIRYLDKLVDELAKGKAMEKILREQVQGCEAAVSPNEKTYLFTDVR